MANEGRLRVAVVGAGSWAQRAHIPGWQRDPRVEVVAMADVAPEPLAAAAAKYNVERTTARLPRLLAEDSASTSSTWSPATGRTSRSPGTRPPGGQARPLREAGPQRLPPDPAAADLAAAKGLKTKLGFTFRYAPAVLYAQELIDAGFVGEPYIFNGYEQNSQWLDPSTPLRQVAPDTPQDVIAVSSIEGYGAPIIDIMHWWLDAPMTSVVGTMRNFVPSRILRDTGR